MGSSGDPTPLICQNREAIGKIVPNGLMQPFARISDMALDLRLIDLIGRK